MYFFEQFALWILCRFRHYYQHILTLKWLQPRAPDAPTGLILASTFGLQVAAHLALDRDAHGVEDLEDEDEEDEVVVGNEAGNPVLPAGRRLDKIERLPSRSTQTSSVTSSITSRRKILTENTKSQDPDIIITSQVEPEGNQPACITENVKDGLAPPSPIMHTRVKLNFQF